jgi:hypothetical protein
MPSAEQIKQFLAGIVLPPLAGVAATWLFVHVHFLALFHITAASVAGELVQLGVWGITTGLSWLTTHNILKGKYTPEAKARVNA